MLPPFTSSHILTNLSASVSQYQNSLSQITQFIQNSLCKNKNVKQKCQQNVQENVSRLKDNFREFAQEWKVELPEICQQFMEIVKKICDVYQQQIERLTEVNKKWEFTCQQLIKNGNNMQTTAKINSLFSATSSSFLQQDNRSSKSSNKKHQVFQVKDNTGYFPKQKDPQISLMREQITELFDEQDSILSTQKLTNSCLKYVQTAKGKQRMHTMSDFQTGNKVLCQVSQITQISQASCKEKSSSRKSSFGSRDSFWSTLKVPLSHSIKGKQNMCISLKDKPKTEKTEKTQKTQKSEKSQKTEQKTTTRMQDLRRNMFKTRSSIDWNR